MEQAVEEYSEISDGVIDEPTGDPRESTEYTLKEIVDKPEYKANSSSNVESKLTRTNNERESEERSKNYSSKKASLEVLLADSKRVAEELGVDWTELLSSRLAQHPSWYVEDREEKSTKKSDSGDGSHEIHDSLDGAHAIIYHRDPKTGKFYFAFEIKPAEHREFPGKASLYGGSIKIGEAPNEGLSREIMEEDPAYKIVIKALNETRYKIAEINKSISGVPSTTYIWAAEIKDPMEWVQYKSSKSKEGEKATLSLEKMISMQDSEFAWGFGPVAKGFGIFISENYGKMYSYRHSSNFYSKTFCSSSAFHNFN